ncbi:MAG: Response regulator rcp1 [Flavobacteriaceae bacterium]|nr:MAG: Response regulator rcp1 [Flavobacteriaceae bacterium]
MNKQLKILLIEDDAIEIMKLNRAVSTLLSEPEIIEANNGEDALNVLKERNIIPNIILLDLNMPKINGIEFLRILKNDEELKHIPTIILTTSDNKKDLLACYEIGIAGYITKPLKYQDYVTRIDVLLSYWSINELIILE